MDWHIHTSDAFRDLLVDPLGPYINISLRSWNGKDFDKTKQSIDDLATPVIFCQLPPPKVLLQNPAARIIWIPMWDHMQAYPQSWWDSLPKSLRVVAFSDAVASRAITAGLTTLRLRYFKNPQEFAPVNWENGRILMYWNRTGLFSRALLQRLCSTLNIQKLFFLPKTDPHIAQQAAYQLPTRIGSTRVEILPSILPRAEYLRKINEANVYLAPRPSEGVGMTFLEAMVRGCAVFAVDAPAMNEYITHNDNGYLFPFPYMNVRQRLEHSIRRRLTPLMKRPPAPFVHQLSLHQDWRTLTTLDLVEIGHKARQHHESGFVSWQAQREAYARFILEW